eukprot:comp22101_c0_seq3/m.32256 comp22101_c0_seq3/g.32256  ORF comp22101_c0_seq3/g.32256 comp22101_c0_seq3/m.32256 type:complete len:304 (+) comp22101_c0_seq3:541-1452(+)
MVDILAGRAAGGTGTTVAGLLAALDAGGLRGALVDGGVVRLARGGGAQLDLQRWEDGGISGTGVDHEQLLNEQLVEGPLAAGDRGDLGGAGGSVVLHADDVPVAELSAGEPGHLRQVHLGKEVAVGRAVALDREHGDASVAADVGRFDGADAGGGDVVRVGGDGGSRDHGLGESAHGPNHGGLDNGVLGASNGGVSGRVVGSRGGLDGLGGLVGGRSRGGSRLVLLGLVGLADGGDQAGRGLANGTAPGILAVLVKAKHIQTVGSKAVDIELATLQTETGTGGRLSVCGASGGQSKSSVFHFR